MGRIDIVLSNIIEQKLRKKVGYKGKGALSQAVEEALILWLNREEPKNSK